MSQDLMDTISHLRQDSSKEMDNALMRVGKATIEQKTDALLSLVSAYCESKGRVSAFDDALRIMQAYYGTPVYPVPER